MIEPDTSPPSGDDDDETPRPSGGSRGAESRGYPTPSERSWIHPAELPSTAAIATPSESVSPRRWVQVPLSVAAAVLLLSGFVLLVTRSTASRTPTSVLTARTVLAAPLAPRTSAGSLVTVTVATTGKSEVGGGVTLEQDTLIATTMAIPDGATPMVTNDRGQREAARVVGDDAATGLSTLAVADPISSPAVTASPTAQASTDSVVALADAVTQDAPTSVDWESVTPAQTTAMYDISGETIGTMSVGGALSRVPGAVLVTPAGKLVAVSDPSVGSGAFIPEWFVEDVAARIDTGATISQGHLAITGRTVTSGGVLIESVSSKGPAWKQLEPGDIIEGVNEVTVRSIGDLLDALYVIGAGGVATVDFTRNGAAEHVSVTLASAP